MAIKNTIFGWLRSTPDKDEELEEAEADEATREYSADRADTIAETIAAVSVLRSPGLLSVSQPTRSRTSVMTSGSVVIQ